MTHTYTNPDGSTVRLPDNVTVHGNRAHIGPNAVFVDSWRKITIRGGTICGGTIRGGAIEGGTIYGGTIEGGTIYGGTIYGGTIKGGTIKGGAIEDGTIYGGTIYGGTIWGGTIRGGAIEDGTIYGGTIYGGTIRGGTIRGGTIYGGTIKGGTIRGGTIRGGTIYGGALIEHTRDLVTAGPVGNEPSMFTAYRHEDGGWRCVGGCSKAVPLGDSGDPFVSNYPPNGPLEAAERLAALTFLRAVTSSRDLAEQDVEQ